MLAVIWQGELMAALDAIAEEAGLDRLFTNQTSGISSFKPQRSCEGIAAS